MRNNLCGKCGGEMTWSSWLQTRHCLKCEATKPATPAPIAAPAHVCRMMGFDGSRDECPACSALPIAAQTEKPYLTKCAKEGPDCDCVNVCKHKPVLAQGLNVFGPNREVSVEHRIQPAQQVDAARCPNCGSEKVGILWSQAEGCINQIACPTCQSHWHCSGLLELAQFFRAASLKLETQPPQSVYDQLVGMFGKEALDGAIEAAKHPPVKDVASSSPLETPAARPWNCICSEAFGVTPEKCGAHGNLNNPSNYGFPSGVGAVSTIPVFATPAPADTGATNWHQPGCPRFSGVGECDCDTNQGDRQ